MIRRAKKEGDNAKVKYYQEVYDDLTRAKYDVTKDDGEYQRDLDADEW